MKGTVPKRLDLCYHCGTFSIILNLYFLIAVTSASQLMKFLTSFMQKKYACSPGYNFLFQLTLHK